MRIIKVYMDKKTERKQRFEKIFYPVAYFVLIVLFVCSGVYAFSKLYYEQIYITGSSMNPTLLGDGESTGGISHYGKADKSRRVINTLKRFDVVITNFPSGWNSSKDGTYIIKRVWAFPGETINLTINSTNVTFSVSKDEKDVCSYTAFISDYAYFNVGNKTFRVNAVGSGRSLTNYQMRDGEYFLMGDNWTNSSDSYYNRHQTGYITNSLIQGKVVQIEGTASVVNKTTLINKKKIQGMFEF